MNKRFRKTTLSLLMAAMIALQPLTSCTYTTHRTRPAGLVAGSAETENNSEEKTEGQHKNEHANKIKVEEIESLDQVKPTFGKFKSYTTMDEQSVLQIIKLAMRDAQKFYLDIGALNMKYDADLNNMTGEKNFYTDFMTEYFYLSRAMSESTFSIDAITKISNNSPENYAHGIMQICPVTTKDTLQQYYRNVFGKKIDYSNMPVIPSAEDLQNIYVSEEAVRNVVQAVYNNIYLSICFDIYNTKCLNPVKHPDYYKAYGGFSEEIRHLAAIGLYGTRRSIVMEGLENGSLLADLMSVKYFDTYLYNLDHYKNAYVNKYIMVDEQKAAQPGSES